VRNPNAKKNADLDNENPEKLLSSIKEQLKTLE